MVMNITDLVNGSVDRTSVEKPAWEGTAIFDVLVKALNDNIQIQYESGRITGPDLAKVYMGGLHTCITQAVTVFMQKPVIEKELEIKAKQIELLNADLAIKQYENTILQPDQHDINLAQVELLNVDKAIKGYENTVLQPDAHNMNLAQISKVNKDVEVSTAQIELLNTDNAIKMYENTVLQPDIHSMNLSQISKINKDVEVSTAQIGVLNADKSIKTYENTVLQPDQHNLALGQITKLGSENAMLVTQEQMLMAQKNEIAPNAAKQRAVQDGQIAQMNAETAYTNSKQTVMVESRIDNLMLEALKAKLSHLSTVGAGGLTPSTNDFNTANSLISATYGRAKNYALPEITFAAGGAYTKAV